MSKDEHFNGKRIINFPSDKNGCGYYRTIIPLSYMTARLNWDSMFMYQFVFDLNLIRMADWIRFQRQCTMNQKRCISEYRKCIDRTQSRARIYYELDDLVHGIEPHNVLAYQFYTPLRKANVVEMMKMSHRVSFSTQFLADFYRHHFQINHSIVIPNFLPLHLWNPTFEDKRTHQKKPTIIFAGSASHVGKTGDLEALIPMIEATLDEFRWLFFGVVPEQLKGKVEFLPWCNFYDYPRELQKVKADLAIAPLGDTIFNLAKSDLKYREFSACNIPILCSSIGQGKGPYDLSKAPNLIVGNNPDDWYSSIKNLLADENKYQETLKIQKEFVEKCWLENPENIEFYKQAYT